jgi:hypothetical protein
VGSLELRPVSVVLLLLLSFSLVVFVLYRFGGLLSKCFHCVLKVSVWLRAIGMFSKRINRRGTSERL